MEAPIDDPSSQHLKDFKLAIEFKYLMKCAPGGVYLLPEIDDIRRLHGVIFVRRGIYRDGVFRFLLILPKAYNDINTYPEIHFTPPIYNPLVDPVTGQLDLRLDESLQHEWMPEKHFLMNALTFLKKIFYMKTYSNFHHAPNPAARQLFEDDKPAFLDLVTEEVKASLRRVHEPQHPSCTIVFTEPKPAHDILRDKVLGKAEEERQRQLAETARKQEEQRERDLKRQLEINQASEEYDDWGSAPSTQERDAPGSAFEIKYRPYDRANEAEDEEDRLHVQKRMAELEVTGSSVAVDIETS